jgi:hypothetical protein
MNTIFVPPDTGLDLFPSLPTVPASLTLALSRLWRS